MKRLIAGGTGLIGRHLVAHWLKKDIPITVLGRDPAKIQAQFGNTVEALTWEDFMMLPDHAIKQFESITNLCGENIADKRWSHKRKDEILLSRILPTQNIVEKLMPLSDQSPRLLNASAIGVYGAPLTEHHDLSSPVDEETLIDFEHPKDFLQEVATQWEMATTPAKAHGVHVNNLRFAVVLTRKGGALEKMLTPFRLGVGGKIGSGQQAFSWIHIDDLIAMIDFLHAHPDIHGAINCVSPYAISQYTLAKTIGAILHKPSFMPMPAIMVKTLFGELGEALLLNGMNVYPKKLIAHDFHFQYPTIEDALMNLLD
jgi:uncharacterized protein